MRQQLKGLQALFFVTDYVMAAKTNTDLVLSRNAIVTAFAIVSSDTSVMGNRLAIYSDRPGTLADHYRRIGENPEAKKEVKKIVAALTDNGIAIDTESDLLMDCIRYASLITEVHEMYGPNPRDPSLATPSPAALTELVNAMDAVFQYRFRERFGLDPVLVSNLMNRLWKGALQSTALLRSLQW